MCIQEELGHLNTKAVEPVLNGAHRIQMPNCSNINSEGNTDSSESTTKATTAPESVRSFAWFVGGCIQPFLGLLNKVAFNDKIKGSQSECRLYLEVCK